MTAGIRFNMGWLCGSTAGLIQHSADVIVKQFSSPIMCSKAIDAVHENRIIKMLDNLERNLDEALGELYYSFSTALCSADEIYAKLATMVDDDALTYLQKEYGTASIKQLKAFRDITDNITEVKGVVGRKLGLGESQYIHEVALRSVLRNERHSLNREDWRR